VEKTVSAVGTGTTLAFTNNVQNGSLIVIAGAMWNTNAVQTISFTGNRGETFVVKSATGPAVTPQTRYFVAYGVTTSGGAETITATLTQTVGTNYISFSIDEFSGVNTTTPLDVDGTNATGTSTTPARAITTVAANALVVAVMTHDSASTTLTECGTCTKIGEEEAVAAIPHAAEFKIAGAAGSVTMDWTAGASIIWYAYAVSFAPAAGTPATPGRRRAIQS